MNTNLAIEIRGLANAIETTQEPERIVQHLKDLIKLAKGELRRIKKPACRP